MNYLYRCVVPKPLLIKELAQGSKGNWKANSLACCKSAERAINAVPDVHQTEMLREDSQLFLRGRLLERQTVLLRALVCSRTRLVSATKVFWPAEYNKKDHGRPVSQQKGGVGVAEFSQDKSRGRFGTKKKKRNRCSLNLLVSHL